MLATVALALLSQRACILGGIDFDIDFYYQGRWGAYSHVEHLDQIAIVKPMRRIEPVTRSYEDIGEKGSCAYVEDEVTVVASLPSVDRAMTIVTPTYPGYRLYPLRKEKRYLVLTCTSPIDRLRAPSALLLAVPNGAELRPEQRFIWAEKKQNSEHFGLAAFETFQTTVVFPQSDARERILLNVAACMPGTTDANVGRVCTYLSSVQPSRPRGATLISYLMSLASKLSRSNQARLYALLSGWNVEGSHRKFFEALERSASDLNVLSLPEDTGPSIIDLSKIVGTQVSGKDVDEWRNRLMELGLRSKSRNIRRLVFISGFTTSDLRTQRRAYRLSLTQEEDLMSVIFRWLAYARNDLTQMPIYEKVDGQRKWTNKSQLVDHWQKLLG